MPPNLSKDLSVFKLYMSDVGLCSYRAGLTTDNITVFDNTFMGGITENFAAQTLMSNGYELYYWESDSIAEVDFIVVINDAVIPVEVKVSANTRSRSLHAYIKKYNPKYAIRISARNFGFDIDNGVKSVPLYAAYLI